MKGLYRGHTAMSESFQSTAFATVLGLAILLPAEAAAQSTPDSAALEATAPSNQEIPPPVRIDQGAASPWARLPSPEFPERAMARGVTEARVMIRCGHDQTGALTDCEVAEESPAGMGFGSASLAGARRARLAPSTIDWLPSDALVAFAVNFRMAPEPPKLDMIEDPSWSRPPRPDFPRSARNAGLTFAQVRLNCEIVPGTGRLRNCLVIEESHAGHRFGAAAVRATRDVSIAPYILRQAAEDAHAVFTVTFTR